MIDADTLNLLDAALARRDRPRLCVYLWLAALHNSIGDGAAREHVADAMDKPWYALTAGEEAEARRVVIDLHRD